MLTNLATDSRPMQDAIVAAGALLPLLTLISFGSYAARSQAAAALAKLISNHPTNRAAAVQAQALLPLVDLLSSGSGAKPGKTSGKGGGAKAEAKAAVKAAAAAGKPEAADCLAALIQGDEVLQSMFVAEGGLTAAVAMLEEEITKPAANRLIGALAPCFADAVTAAKK
jgi:hypothetical protein